MTDRLCSLWLVPSVRLTDEADTVPAQSIHFCTSRSSVVYLWISQGLQKHYFYLKNILQHFFIHKWISERDHNCADMLQVAIHTVSCISRYDNLQIMFKIWTISFDISDRTRDTRILRVIYFNEPIKCLFHCGNIQTPSEQLHCSWPKQLACLLHNRIYHKLNKTHVCACITLEFYACIVT